MLRKALRVVGWTAASLLGLVVALYLVALAINWRDREPSATAVRFTQSFRDRPAVADADNAFVYLRRWAPHSDREKQPARVQEFVAACRSVSDECARAFEGADGLLAEWQAAETEMLDRYAAFTALTGWSEQNSFDEGSLTAYVSPGDGQWMLLLRARELARQGDAASVRSLLERDLQFWRSVLQSSDILISKLLAAALINRHLEWGSLVLRNLPAGLQAAAIPESWSRGISDVERSMQRCIVGEWQFSSAMLRQASAESFGIKDEFLIARAASWLFKPMWQEQDTINRYAEHYWSVIRAFDVPLSDYPRAVGDIQQRAQKTAQELFPFGAVYNMSGAWIFAIALSSTDLTGYAVRVGDIEGVRRAAVTAATLRAAGVEAKDVPAALAKAEQRDPYTDEPFAWDAERRAVVFRGLQAGERGEHRIYY